MTRNDDFLVEIGTEELPPKALRALMVAFGENLGAAIDDARLSRGDVHTYASPRRLTVLVEKLALQQDDREVEKKGPPTKVAFDKDGNPTPAASAFANKCGVSIDELGREQTAKGEWLTFRSVEQGKAAGKILGILEDRL